MGCFVAGAGAIQWHATSGLATMDAPQRCQQDDPLSRDISSWAKGRCGGTYRNFALAPYERPLPEREAADLEIRRAMRIGLDGFTFDAWAGGPGAMKLIDLMFEICEEKDYPFELTITLDSTCLSDQMEELKPYPGSVWVKAVKWLLDKHGKSPKLARRDGKPLIMGYQSAWPWVAHLWGVAGKRLGDAGKDALQAEVNRLRTTPEGWKLIGEAYRAMSKEIGQEIYWEFCTSAFFHGAESGRNDATWVESARTAAKELPAVGTFMWEGPVPEVAKAVVAEGKEWCHPMKMQYENYGYFQAASPGIDWVLSDWKFAREIPSTLIQHITWNDYHEATNLSPGYNTRHSYYDITGYFIRWWKMGKEPVPDRDRVYVFSHKYAHGSRMFPFQAKTRSDNVIAVVTILTRPARMRMPGRDQEWDAPAGLHQYKAPLTAGPVAVELVRSGRVEVRLECPEPVSDRPFRQDTGKVCISTEFERHWELDFGKDRKPFVYAEYADADSDGLPNWFEMLWFGKFGDMSTATVADPKGDPDRDGRTNLEEYLAQTDPTTAPPPEAPSAGGVGEGAGGTSASALTSSRACGKGSHHAAPVDAVPPTYRADGRHRGRVRRGTRSACPLGRGRAAPDGLRPLHGLPRERRRLREAGDRARPAARDRRLRPEQPHLGQVRRGGRQGRARRPRQGRGGRLRGRAAARRRRVQALRLGRRERRPEPHPRDAARHGDAFQGPPEPVQT